MTLKIGIISDTHLGDSPSDPDLSRDSFEAFDEALKILAKNKADLIIHAGDFYDRTDPAPWIREKAVTILRSTITGTKPKMKVLEGKANFEAEDVNIAIPFFLIHGTHDRPIGKPIAAPPFQDLVAAGYANYIDADPENTFAVTKVVLQKGTARVSISGIGHRPEGYINESIAKSGIPLTDHTVNVCCTHNAIKGIIPTEGEYIELNAFAGLDFVIAGHAHIPRLNENGVLATLEHPDMPSAKLLVPGATVATGIYPQEEGKKYAHLIEISDQNKLLCVESFDLERARRVFCETIEVSGLSADNIRRRIEAYLASLPLDMLKKKPLVRVDLIGTLLQGVSRQKLKLEGTAARFRNKIQNWSDMLVLRDVYSEDELKHLEELRNAVQTGTGLPAAFNHFSKKLHELKFKGKHFTTQELYDMFSVVKSPQSARKRVEAKLNEMLNIGHD
jgi:double-strand break repair protein MRE11